LSTRTFRAHVCDTAQTVAGRCRSICRAPASFTPHPLRVPAAAVPFASWARRSPRRFERLLARWFVVQHVREKVTCRACESSEAPAPFHPIARGRAGPNLLAEVVFGNTGCTCR
jgi:hypothetical protein